MLVLAPLRGVHYVWRRLAVFSPAVRQALEADVQGADRGGLILHGLLRVGLRRAHQGRQPLGQVPAEQQVDAGVGAAVQTGQQHQDGKGCSWNDGEREREKKKKKISLGFMFHVQSPDFYLSRETTSRPGGRQT